MRPWLRFAKGFVYKAKAYRSFGVNRSLCGRCGLLGLAFFALALSGCGRRGDPDPPPDVPAGQAVPMQVQTINPMAGDPAQPGHTPVKQAGTSNAVSDKTFFLDPLVK